MKVLATNVKSRISHQNPNKKTILFFAPEAGVTLYIQMHAIVARTLMDLGHNVLFVRCFNSLPRCPVKDMHALTYDASVEQNRNICLRCLESSYKHLNQYGLDYIDSRELIDESVLNRVKKAIDNLPEQIFEFVYEGVNVGKLAFYDFAIANKHPVDLAITGKAVEVYIQYIENAMIAIELFKAVNSRYKIDAVHCFDEYAMMSAVRLYARNQGIPSKMLSIAYHLNGDMRRVVGMTNLTVVKDFEWRLSNWTSWKNLSLTSPIIEANMDDLITRLSHSGMHIYSPNKSQNAEYLYEELSLTKEKKLLVAYTSSRDEHDALLLSLQGMGYSDLAKSDAFPDTFTWLNTLIPYVEKSLDLQLVVRIHPRVGATTRSNVVSSDYSRYKAEFSGIYKNCRIVWPADDISSYDLAELADAALISWSSMGLELARMGIPVLSGNHSIIAIAPRDETFIQTASTPDEYFNKLSIMLQQDDCHKAARNVITANRWYNMFNLGNSIDLSDLINHKLITDLPNYKRPRNANLVERVFVGQEDAINYNREELISQQTMDSFGLEASSCADQLDRFISYICLGDKNGAKIALSDISVDGKNLIFSSADKSLIRYSPMLSRLVGISQRMRKINDVESLSPCSKHHENMISRDMA